MYSPKIVRCVLSGSFRKDNEGLHDAYNELIVCGCQVLSPHRLEFESTKTLFVKDVAEIDIDQDTIEQHHLLSIHQSDFLWIHAPEGYIGLSTALEVGYAIAHKIPIFSRSAMSEPLFTPFIRVVGSVYDALKQIG